MNWQILNPFFFTKYDVNNPHPKGCFGEHEITYKFKKTQTSKLISKLQEFFNEMTTYINDRHSIEEETMTKKIFIKFIHGQNHITNDLNNAYMGEHIHNQFQYFIGYEVLTNKFKDFGVKDKIHQKNYITKILYASPHSTVRKKDTCLKEKEDLFISLPRYNQSVESFEKEFSIIDWTQEREDFCKRIKETFIEVNKELSFFLHDIDSNKMDMLMKSNLKFLKN